MFPGLPAGPKWLLSPGRRPVWGRAAGRVWELGGCSGDRRRVEPAGLSEPPYLRRPGGKGGRGEPVLLRRSREKRSRGRCVRRTGTRWGDDGGAAANAPHSVAADPFSAPCGIASFDPQSHPGRYPHCTDEETEAQGSGRDVPECASGRGRAGAQGPRLESPVLAQVFGAGDLCVALGGGAVRAGGAGRRLEPLPAWCLVSVRVRAQGSGVRGRMCVEPGGGWRTGMAKLSGCPGEGVTRYACGGGQGKARQNHTSLGLFVCPGQ